MIPSEKKKMNKNIKLKVKIWRKNEFRGMHKKSKNTIESKITKRKKDVFKLG